MIKYATFLFFTSIMIFSQHSFARETIGCEPMSEKNNFTVFEIDDINQRVFLKREKLADDNNKWYEHNEELEVKHYSSFKILALSKGKNVLDSFAFSINYKREIYLDKEKNYFNLFHFV